jgi:hypothetical protein
MDEVPAVEILQPLDPHVFVKIGEHVRVLATDCTLRIVMVVLGTTIHEFA